MKTKTLRMMCLSICLLAVPGSELLAQGPPGGGGPGGAGGPGRTTRPMREPDERNTHGDRNSARGERQAPGRNAAPQKNALGFGPVGRWWDDKSVIQQIGLRKDQQKKMDAIFDANRSGILASYKTLQKAQANLAAINKDPKADKNAVFAAIDAVNNARSDLQKTTSAMLLQIRHEMDPAQITKLEQIP